MHDDLARPCRGEVLELRVDRLGVAVAALDPGRAQEAADELGLVLVGHDLHDGHFLVHERSVHTAVRRGG